MDKEELPKSFVPDHLGSAPLVNLDGASELYGFATEQGVKARREEEITGRGAPWGYRDSLVDMCEEVNVDFDTLIEGIKNDRADNEIAEELGVSDKCISHLKNHFFRYGINDVQGQD